MLFNPELHKGWTAERVEFARIAEINLRMSYLLKGKSTPPDTQMEIVANDMAVNLSQIPVKMLDEIFKIARKQYASIPTLKDLQKAWDSKRKDGYKEENHVNNDFTAPRKSMINLTHQEARLVRLVGMRNIFSDPKLEKLKPIFKYEDWMTPLLDKEPSIDEVRVFLALAKDMGYTAWYQNNKDVAPNWWMWAQYYELVAPDKNDDSAENYEEYSYETEFAGYGTIY